MPIGQDLKAFAKEHSGLVVGGIIVVGVVIFVKLKGGTSKSGSTDLNTIHQDLQQIDSDLIASQQVGYTSLTGAIPGFTGTPTANPPLNPPPSGPTNQDIENLINSKHIATNEAQFQSDFAAIMAKLGIKPSTSGKGSAHLDFVPDFMPELSHQLSDFFHDRNAYIDQYTYGMPGDFNEDAGV